MSFHCRSGYLLSLMTAAPRLDVLLSLWLLLSLILNEALATPHSLHAANIYARKVDPVISYSSNGSVSVLDPTTEEAIPQGPGTDGSGSNFSLPAVIWLVFLLVIGAPLAVAGIRGWRCTTGVAIGLVAIVCCESHEPHLRPSSSNFKCMIARIQPGPPSSILSTKRESQTL